MEEGCFSSRSTIWTVAPGFLYEYVVWQYGLEPARLSDLCRVLKVGVVLVSECCRDGAVYG